MNGSSPASSHRSHPELLVVRLYGDDLSGDERDRALDLVARCRECAALLADISTIADETRSLPVPARPRDFFLTPADAERLRRRRLALPLGFLRWSRPLGRAMLAAGLAGVFFIGAASLVPTGSATSAPAQSDRNSAAWAPAQPIAAGQTPATAGGANDAAHPSAQTAPKSSVPLAVSSPSARSIDISGGESNPSSSPASVPSAPGPSGSAAFAMSTPPPAATPPGKGATKGAGSAESGPPASGGESYFAPPSNTPSGPPPPGAPDPRTLGLLGSAALAAVGAGLLLLRRFGR